jgi:UDP-glucuronate 4-epimerase
MTILVTGGAGFIGSHLAERLLQHNERVLILDNFNDYYDPALKRANVERLRQYPKLTVVEGDIRNTTLIQQLFKAYGIRKVAHLAAMAGVRTSVAQVPLYVEVNINGTMNLLEAARQNEVEIFVSASTSSVYGLTQRLPFTEDDPADHPLAVYPATKRSAEILAHSYHHLFGMNITVLRFFNVYGPAGRPDMMPLRVMNAVVSGQSIVVFNNGDIHRDWTYVEDTVSGVEAALNRPMGYEIINLGAGQPVSLNDFIATIEGLAGKTAARIHQPTPPSDPPITFCNNEKARRLLGFDPQTTVQQGLEKTWAWFQQTYLGG